MPIITTRNTRYIIALLIIFQVHNALPCNAPLKTVTPSTYLQKAYVTATDPICQLASPSDFSITNVAVNNALTCNGTGSVEINISGGADLAIYNVELVGSGLDLFETTLRNNTLQVDGISAGVEFNKIIVTEHNSSLTATHTEGLKIGPSVPRAIIFGDSVQCPAGQNSLFSTEDQENCTYLWSVVGGSSGSSNTPYEFIINWDAVESGYIGLLVTDTLSLCTSRAHLNITFGDTTAPALEDCSGTYVFVIESSDNLSYAFKESDENIVPTATDFCSGENVDLKFSVAGSGNIDISEFVGYQIDITDGQYIVWTATDELGNTSTCVTNINFAYYEKPPTAFSPNNDGHNDSWQIDMLANFPQSIVRIFNRWGNPIWKSEEGYPTPWDGKKNGNLLPVDTYYYIIDLGNDSETIKGYINLIY